MIFVCSHLLDLIHVGRFLSDHNIYLFNSLNISEKWFLFARFLFVPLENFSLIWIRHHQRWMTANFWPILYRATATVTLANHLWWSSLRTCDTYTCCRAFGSGAFTTCFKDLGQSRPVIESRSPACEANALALSHRCGLLEMKLKCYSYLMKNIHFWRMFIDVLFVISMNIFHSRKQFKFANFCDKRSRPDNHQRCFSWEYDP